MPITNSQEVIPNNLPAESYYKNGRINSYEEILQPHGCQYISKEYYWQVGEINIERGWILNLSVVKAQIPQLLHVILPTLISDNVPFKIVRNSNIAQCILEGSLGNRYLCKIVVIYPYNDTQAAEVAHKIIQLTKDFKGPCIPTNQYLGGIVYTQFISFTTTKQEKIYAQRGDWKSSRMINNWPFHELRSENIPHRQKLLNLKYYPISVIKEDPKGHVIKALYFKKPWKICTCVLKQGRKYMLLDDAERDMQDRLIWQYDLHQQLASYFSLPKIIDFFIENQNAYLVLEYIRGASMSTLIQNLYLKDNWDTLSTKNQLFVTNHLLEIVKIIQHLHEKGFIHRDITPENFLIDKDQHIRLIDVELMWSLNSKKYSTPFQLGTRGFISAEQQEAKTPTTKEDIYAIGALMLFIFTNLHPLKFSRTSSEQLRTALCFLTGNERLAKLICDCLSEYPHNRPDSETLVPMLELYREDLQQKKAANIPHSTPELYNIPIAKLEQVIQTAIQGLSHPSVLSPQRYWISNLATAGDKLKTPQIGTTAYIGWSNGVSGPLWLLAIAQKSGFNIENCMGPYNESWKFITKKYSVPNADTSFYTGTAGIALALSAAFESHLLVPDNTELRLENFFNKHTTESTLAAGIAGQGLALLKASQWMDAESSQQLLRSNVQFLLNSQCSDGSWKLTSHDDRKKRTELTLANGIPGIIWFLLHHLDIHPDNMVLASTVKACNWLIRSAYHKSKDNLTWAILNTSRSGTAFSTNNGSLGLILVLIKAFGVTGDIRYRDIATSSLKKLPDHPHFTNFTLGDGLAGLGELYLEAFKAFKDPIWFKKASWIAQLFIHTFQFRSLSDGYWIMEGEQPITADLFTGNAGAIHFLMHYLLPDKLHHPLIPYTMINPGSV